MTILRKGKNGRGEETSRESKNILPLEMKTGAVVET